MSLGPNSLGDRDVPHFDAEMKVEQFRSTGEIISEVDVAGALVNPDTLLEAIDFSKSTSPEAYLVISGGQVYREPDSQPDYSMGSDELNAFLPSLRTIVEDYYRRRPEQQGRTLDVEVSFYVTGHDEVARPDAGTTVPHVDGHVDDLSRLSYLASLGRTTLFYPGKFTYHEPDEITGQPTPSLGQQVASKDLEPISFESGTIVVTDNQTVHQAPQAESGERLFIVTELQLARHNRLPDETYIPLGRIDDGPQDR